MIGVFDSGVGGLSVLREIRRQLPAEPLMYVADSGHAPYGDQTPDYIEARCSRIVRFLVDSGARAIVVACNTATVTAVRALREWAPVPIVAIEPAIKPAVGLTRSGVIGVLATRRTVSSAGVTRLCERYGQGRRILLQACPGLAEQVERVELSGDHTTALLRRYLVPLLDQGADTLVLGCTHYPFLAPAIRSIAGADVTVLDPAAAVARELCRRLGIAGAGEAMGRDGAGGGEAAGGGAGHAASDAASAAPHSAETFFSSGPVDQASAVISALWGRPSRVQPLPPEPALSCPVCGGPNDCAPAGCGSFDVDCWCTELAIPAQALQRVPADQRRLACLCPRCARFGSDSGELAREVGRPDRTTVRD